MAFGRSFPSRTIPAADKIAESQSSWYHVLMNEFTIIKPEELSANAFSTIGKDWLLITAEVEGKVNTMTASWGGLGVMWHKNAAFIFIRPQRYTKEFVDGSSHLSLCVLEDGLRKELNYLGTVSGRDESKIEKAGLTVRREDGVPYFDQSRIVLLCRKLFSQQLDPNCFVDVTIEPKIYPNKDYHYMYVCEVEKVLVR